MTLFKGLGDACVRTTDLAGGPSAQRLFPYPAYDFEFSQKASFEDAEAYRGGIRVVEETIENKVESILKLKTQIANWHLLGLSMGLLERTLTNFTLPKVKRAIVPADGVINDAAITTENLAGVLVSIERQGAWGQAGSLHRSNATTPPVRGVKVAAGTITCNVAQAGAPIMYVLDTPIASANVYGGAGNLPKLGELEFYGDVFDNSADDANGGKIWIPRLQRHSRPTLSFNGKLIELETEYRCLLPSGWTEPFFLVDGHSVT
jgi:hypothetical protein